MYLLHHSESTNYKPKGMNKSYTPTNKFTYLKYYFILRDGI